MIKKNDWNFYISLFPVSKYQFEHFLSDVGSKGGYTDNWYRELLKLSPRKLYKACKDKVWQLFITALSYKEIKPFFRYLGRGFRLPTQDEWIKLHKVSREIKHRLPITDNRLPPNTALPVSLWLKEKLFPLTEEGILEMVKKNDKIYCIGRPYQGLLSNTWQPEQIREVNWELCRQAVGFRMVKQEEVRNDG
jgi:hypothetical protein